MNLEHLLGIENCFQLQKESQTLAVICKAAITIMAFDSREMLLEWQAQIAEILGHSKCFVFFPRPLNFTINLVMC